MFMQTDSRGRALYCALQWKGWQAREYRSEQAVFEDMKPVSAAANNNETKPDKQSRAK